MRTMLIISAPFISKYVLKYIILIFDQGIYCLTGTQRCKPPDFTLILPRFFHMLICFCCLYKDKMQHQIHN
jgi:hypothetical protein